MIINNSSQKPIYEQIIDQIKVMIIKGELKADTMLPSVRSLSREQKISALTVKKAYDILEQEGFIVTVQGKGSFVVGVDEQQLMEEKRKEVENDLEKAITKGRKYHMTNAEILDLIQLIMEDLEG